MPITWRHLVCVWVLSLTAVGGSPAHAQEESPAEHDGLPLLQPIFDSESALPLEELENNPCWPYDCFSQATFEGRRFAGVGSDVSAVYVLVRDDSGDFRFEAELPVPEPSISYDGTPDGVPYPREFVFGRALALDGKELMVSHERTDEIAGTVDGRVYLYVRTRDGWSHRQTIPLGACDAGQWSIDLDAGTALLGTCVFERDCHGNYALVALLTADDGQPLDDLVGSDGKRTALDGRTVVIGVPSADGGAGAAYVFRRHGSRWSQVARLAPASPAESSEFGAAVDLEGNLLSIGAPRTPGATLERPGVVHLYTRRGRSWERAQVLTNPLPQEETLRLFGDSVAVDGGRVLVGTLPSPLGSSDDFLPGAYLYERSAGSFAPTRVLAVSWVTSVFLSGNTALAGTFAVRAEWWLGFDVPTEPPAACH